MLCSRSAHRSWCAHSPVGGRNFLFALFWNYFRCNLLDVLIRRPVHHRRHCRLASCVILVMRSRSTYTLFLIVPVGEYVRAVCSIAAHLGKARTQSNSVCCGIVPAERTSDICVWEKRRIYLLCYKIRSWQLSASSHWAIYENVRTSWTIPASTQRALLPWLTTANRITICHERGRHMLTAQRNCCAVRCRVLSRHSCLHSGSYDSAAVGPFSLTWD